MMAGIRGHDTRSISVGWCVAQRMGLIFRLYGETLLGDPVLMLRLAYDPLPHPHKNDDGRNGHLCSSGANFTGVTVWGSARADGSGSGGTRVGLSYRASRPFRVSKGCRYNAGLGKPTAKLDKRWYFHDQ